MNAKTQHAIDAAIAAAKSSQNGYDQLAFSIAAIDVDPDEAARYVARTGLIGVEGAPALAATVRKAKTLTAKVVPISAAKRPKPSKPVPEWDDSSLLCTKNGVRKNQANVLKILEGHPLWKGVLAFDEFNLEIVKLRCPPTEDPSGFVFGSEWAETDNTKLTAWLQTEYGAEFASGIVLEATIAAAQTNKFHPVRQWLASLRWDRKPRLDSWLSDYFGVRDSAYAQAVGSRWMISAVARALEPGCKADHLIVLEGSQGSGKSQGSAALVPVPSMFADTGIVIGDKDSYQNLRGKWIYELAEMASVKGREVEKIKQFLSSQIDTYRASYGRKSRDWPRQVVFVGTTNEHCSYLADSTGNRRFWPVTCGTIDVARIAKDRDQLWAEAAHRYHAGEAWHLDTPELRQLAADEQEKRAAVDPWEEFVSQWLRSPTLQNGYGIQERLDPNRGITTGEIAQGAIGLQKKDTTPAVEAKIGRIMAKLDWDRRQVRRDGQRVWVYYDPNGPASPVVTGSDRQQPVTQKAVN